MIPPARGGKDPVDLVELLLKIIGALSGFAPLLNGAIGVLPVRPAIAGWMPWIAVGVAIVAALVGASISKLALRAPLISFFAILFAYVALVVIFPTPLTNPLADRLLLTALGVTYVLVFASFSFLVSHLLLRLARMLS